MRDKSIRKKTNCLHTPYRLKFTVASRGLPATARLFIIRRSLTVLK